MTMHKRVPSLTFVVNPYRKVEINLSGCNFDCKGCFALAKQETGRTLVNGWEMPYFTMNQILTS